MKDVDWEIVSYGLKWIEYKDMLEMEEVEVIWEVIWFYMEVVGMWLCGWYIGWCLENMVCLVVEEGGFDYIFDIYDDDFFYWFDVNGCDQLIILYMLEVNDMWFFVFLGWSSGEDFFDYFCNVFDMFYVEGEVGVLKMMLVGLYCCLIGCLGKIVVLKKFIDYIKVYDGVWCFWCIEIVEYW